MSIKTFWTVLLKILGLYLVLCCFMVIPISLSTLTSFSSAVTTSQVVQAILMIIITVGIYLVILRLFVFKTEWLINKLQLEKGFTEEKIEFNISKTAILSIALIVIGGLILVDALPDLCKQIFSYYQLRKNSFGGSSFSPTSGWIIFYFIKAIIGYLLMTRSRNIVSLIEKHSESQVINEI